MEPARVVETKRTLDGRAQRFECIGVSYSPRLAVIRFNLSGMRRLGDYVFPAGSYSLGFFWPGRSYNCYRFTRSDGGAILYRFDVVDRVRIAPGRVTYRDLALDVLVSPEGQVTVEDEDEVAAAARHGWIGARERRRIDLTRALLVARHRRIIAEVESDLLPRPPSPAQNGDGD